jgi:RNA polymerase sigma factor (sigma-70 family)
VNCQEEEAVQATFLALWRKASNIDLVGDSALLWLLGVCRFECRNIRSREFKKRTQALGEAEANLEAAGPRIEDQVITRQLIEQVNQYVAELSDVDQAIYKLCVLEDFTYDAAARKLGISHGTVRNRLSRLKRTLRNGLGSPSALP